ncbi:hypothetical protein VTK56DRAFT_5633 [Thermocarpiscus australiensis]
MDSYSDSDFYGDEETISALEDRVNNIDLAAWWDRHKNAFADPLRRQGSRKPPAAAGPLHNEHEGDPYAWQLSESVDDFLARLPPATTDLRPGVEWIWISNPFIPPRPRQALDRFLEAGTERLELFSSFQKMASASGGKSDVAIQRDVAKARAETAKDLRELAADCNVLTGKWMLFPDPRNVNDVWARVARATAANELGVGAKVATRAESEKERLICIYTKDFRDKDDVARVLKRMGELELVRPDGRQIYYKSDAWTHLGIYGGNSWGISASIYSSREIFSYIKKVDSTRS